MHLACPGRRRTCVLTVAAGAAQRAAQAAWTGWRSGGRVLQCWAVPSFSHVMGRDNMILIQAPDSAITLTPGIRALCPVSAAALASQPKVCKLDRIFHWNFMKSEFAGR